MKKIAFSLLIFTLITPVIAEEIPVNIKADLLKYKEGTSIVTASGSVEVKLKEITIHADSLLMDTKTNIVTAEGNVTMSGLQYDANCSAVTYPVNTELPEFKNFSTVISPEGVKGKLFLTSELIVDNKNKFTGTESKSTTCDYKEPHYFTAARKVEYYPSDKIVGYFNTAYLLDAPIIWLPYLVYDLKKEKKRNWVIGHNDVEGDFIKTAWDYPKGQVFIDEMAKKGLGYGANYNYGFNNQNGTLYLYHIDEVDTRLSDWVTKLNHTIGINDKTKLGLGYSSSTIYQVPSGRFDQSTYSLNFNHQSDKTLTASLNYLDNRLGAQERFDSQIRYAVGSFNTNYYLNFERGKNFPQYSRTSQRLNYSGPLLSDKARLNFNANYYRNIQAQGEYGDERLEPNLDISYKGPFYCLKLYENWYLDLDRDLYSGDESNQYLEAQPELTCNFDAMDLKLLNLSPSVAYGWYHEVAYAAGIGRNRDFATGRYKATLNANKSVPLILGTTFNFGLGLDQFLYDTGDEMNAFREDFNLNSQGYNFLRNDLKYTRGISDGNSPFFFDKLSTKYNNIRETLTLYHENKINWANTCGFNYETNKYFNYDSSLTINPAKQLSAYLRSGYDIENQNYLDLSSGIKFMPWDKFSFDMNLVNDLNLGGLKQGNYLINLETADEKDWGNHWQFKYGFVYDPASKNFLLRDIMIVKDLHCWEVKYTYSDYRKEMSFIFTLKAFPGEPLGYSGSRGFYFDSFEKALNEEIGQSSPARY